MKAIVEFSIVNLKFRLDIQRKTLDLQQNKAKNEMGR